MFQGNTAPILRSLRASLDSHMYMMLIVSNTVVQTAITPEITSVLSLLRPKFMSSSSRMTLQNTQFSVISLILVHPTSTKVGSLRITPISMRTMKVMRLTGQMEERWLTFLTAISSTWPSSTTLIHLPLFNCLLLQALILPLTTTSMSRTTISTRQPTPLVLASARSIMNLALSKRWPTLIWSSHANVFRHSQKMIRAFVTPSSELGTTSRTLILG
mmetsp:Transcript_15441/g.33714  ORF Transcript_15441/g.33714 Transcript_15441/m.33714 type:complete len:216 (+) Transcript_15441:1265-1912(+)